MSNIEWRDKRDDKTQVFDEIWKQIVRRVNGNRSQIWNDSPVFS